MAIKSKDSVDLNVLEKVLDDLGLLQRRNSSVSRSFDFSKIRGETYPDYWKSYYKENWFDFQLKDLSLISFGVGSISPSSFLYLGCPINCIPEEDYYTRFFSEDNCISYDEYIATCPTLENFTYIRYDHSPKQYNDGIHPANHVHVGYGQSNRMGIVYQFNILSFASFIIRQVYPDHWKVVLDNPTRFVSIFNAKSSLVRIPDSLYGNRDREQDFYLV